VEILSDAWIMRNIVMDADELIRVKQITKQASPFKEKDSVPVWE
jgi:hypothetical protein